MKRRLAALLSLALWTTSAPARAADEHALMAPTDQLGFNEGLYTDEFVN